LDIKHYTVVVKHVQHELYVYILFSVLIEQCIYMYAPVTGSLVS